MLLKGPPELDYGYTKPQIVSALTLHTTLLSIAILPLVLLLLFNLFADSWLLSYLMDQHPWLRLLGSPLPSLTLACVCIWSTYELRAWLRALRVSSGR